jgi:hypothetical protein
MSQTIRCAGECAWCRQSAREKMRAERREWVRGRYVSEGRGEAVWGRGRFVGGW